MPLMPPSGAGDTRGSSASSAARLAAACGRPGSSTSDIATVPVVAVGLSGEAPGSKGLLPRLGRGDVGERRAVLRGEAWPLAAQLRVDLHRLPEQLAVVLGVATVERGRGAVVHRYDRRVIARQAV